MALILALPQIWQARQTKAVQFLLAWIIPTWLLFEAVPTKLVHYTLPTYPALALLAAAFAPVGLAKAGLGLRWVAMLALLPGLGLGVAVLNLAIRTEAEAVWPMAVGLALACVTASAAALAILRQRTARLGPRGCADVGALPCACASARDLARRAGVSGGHGISREPKLPINDGFWMGLC